MKNFYGIGLIILAMIIYLPTFPQKENAKGNLTGEQQIELSEGYSFISSRIMAENPDMQDVLQGNLVNLDFVRNSQGFMLQKIGPVWVNNIGDWANTEGYLFKMSTADELTITGDVIDPVTPISLEVGFQFVSYLPETSIDALIAFETILGDDLDFIRNSQGQILRKIGPNWVNGIGDCKPGEGYLVKMFNDDVLIYPITFGVPCPGIPTVTYEGQVYNTVLVGDQCWLKENLNVGTMINGTEEMTDNSVIEKYCFDNDPANCETYGGLYQWHEMMEYSTTPGVQGICPSGWHLPTDGEWTTLTDFLGGANYAGGKMKEAGTTHWNPPNTGATNESGFTALPAGLRDTYSSFLSLGHHAYFWSSSESYTSNAWYQQLGLNYSVVYRLSLSKSYGFSSRCLQDGTTPINQPPEPPSSPNPEDGAENQSIEVDLSWTCTDPEGDPITYDVYFGIEATPTLVISGQTETTYDPGILGNNTEYFWKIIAHDDHSNTTEGSVWSFTTEEGGTGQCGDPFTDPRDEQTYNTVQIGDQCWMAENLNIGTMINGTEEMTDNSVIEKYCYDNNLANCETYGGLYQWHEMMEYSTTPGLQGICPSGWHLPTDGEWTTLTDFLGGASVAGGKMKEAGTTHWNSPNTGATNESGFTALPAGYRSTLGYFSRLGNDACFWSSSEDYTNDAWYWGLLYDDDDVYCYSHGKSYGFSSRCLQD